MNKRKFVVALFLLFSIRVCTPSASAQAQPPQKGAKAGPQPAQAAAKANPGTLSLEQAVGLALAHSPALALARVRYSVAKNEAGVDRAEFRPNLYTGSGATYTNGFPQTPGGAAPSVFELSYTQALFNPRKRGQLRADEDLAKNQELEYENTRSSVMVRAATVYLELAEARHSLQLLGDEKASEQKILDVTRARAAAGLELPVTLTEDELQLAKIEQKIVEFESQNEILSDQLRTMTGIPASEPIEVSPTEVLASESAEPASNLVDAALAHSTEIREAQNVRRAREHLLKGARGAYWPTIDLIGQYSVLSKINNYDQFFKSFQRNNVNVGIEVTIPLYSARTSANVALARSQLNEAELELSSQKRTVRIGAEQKMRTLREMEAGREVARLDLQLAQEQLQDVQARFDAGRATLRDVEQARLTESEKWLAFLDADLAREKAQLALLEATGQLAQVFH